jgi:hypothetical protein
VKGRSCLPFSPAKITDNIIRTIIFRRQCMEYNIFYPETSGFSKISAVIPSRSRKEQRHDASAGAAEKIILHN